MNVNELRREECPRTPVVRQGVSLLKPPDRFGEQALRASCSYTRPAERLLCDRRFVLVAMKDYGAVANTGLLW